jgi:acyl-CoA thioester hydrolase
LTTFRWPVRVYYEDTDAGGVVYYANYLKFMERARTEWLRDRGFEQDALREREGVLFVVHAVAVRYRQPARFNDLLMVESRIDRMGRVRIVFGQRVCRDTPEAELVCDGRIEVACVTADSFRPTAIPERIRAEFSGEP